MHRQVDMMRVVEIDNLSRAGDIEGLLAALCDEDEHTREVAADALGAFADERVEKALREVEFEDPVQTVRDHAARSRGRVVERLKVEKGTMV
ncbi:MAG TPA: HEAT repeat domain-containing protein [Methanoculleus sp.]|nr:HEAT repeat domain-containing protein [Methanoculleus sp.]